MAEYSNDYAVSPYKMPLTLEQHLRNLSQNNDEVRNLESAWCLLKNKLVEELQVSSEVYPSYSKHDASHSRSIVHSIERILGENRISALSPTDTFMILACAYAHDYGMALSYAQIISKLKSEEFQAFIESKEKVRDTLSSDEAHAIHTLWLLKNGRSSQLSIVEIYRAITNTLQFYLRPHHWQGVEKIADAFQGVIKQQIKKRFINGSEGIIQMCMCHGLQMKDVMNMSFRADGIVSDDYHPRFVAEMLRLGDLLDLDNSRFPAWFENEVVNDTGIIPALSVSHYYKHESVTHLLITPDVIEITAQCGTSGDMTVTEDLQGRYVAGILSEWLSWLQQECTDLTLHWNEIAPANFGRAPGKLKTKILIGTQEYNANEHHLQMRMSQERVMSLLQGTNIYRNKYVGIREMLQNAVDASLLQLWSDILENKYLSYELSKDVVSKGFEFPDLIKFGRHEIFGNYDIVVEVIRDYQKQKVFVVIKDKGIGIKPDEVQFIANLGSSKDNNERVKKIQAHMPAWLKPSGVFGIGLQSAFQLTNCIDFYTRQPNQPELNIRLTFRGQNRGWIDYMPIYKDEHGLYADNTVPGTNVKIEIDPEKFKDSEGEFAADEFTYYDPTFNKNTEIDMLFIEISSACQDIIKESAYDYFNIVLKETTIFPDHTSKTITTKIKRRCYFFPRKTGQIFKQDPLPFGESFDAFQHGFPYAFIPNKAYYWDQSTNRIYLLAVRPCTIVTSNAGQQVFLPKPVPSLFSISYKYNRISNTDTLYETSRLHAGFVDMSVQILDDQPQKYLNIDRDKLRTGALKEGELLRVQTPMLTKWCEWFVHHTNRWKNMPLDELIPLMFAFYQSVDSMLFERFYATCNQQVDLQNCFVGDELLLFSELFNSQTVFTTEINSNNKGKNCVSVKTAHHFPHKHIHIFSILSNSSKGALCYSFNLSKAEEGHEGIDMDEEAAFDDYKNAMAYPLEVKTRNSRSNATKPDFRKLVRKLFKPNSSFPNLIVSEHPHTFHKGVNLTSNVTLDYTIDSYILSPFDKDTCSLLGKIIGKAISHEPELDSFIHYVMDSDQMKQCIHYVWNQRFHCAGGYDRQIETEYRIFVKNVVETLYRHREKLGYSESLVSAAGARP